jgi:hypothetical protein
MKKTLVFLFVLLITLAYPSLAYLGGCTENVTAQIVECTGSLSGTTMDVTNASIYIYNATWSGGQRITTNFTNGFINLSNVVFTTSPTFIWNSSTMYIVNYTHSGAAGNGAAGESKDGTCTNPHGQNGGNGGTGSDANFYMYTSIKQVSGFGLTLYSGAGGPGGMGGGCGENSCTSGNGGNGGSAGGVTVVIGAVNVSNFVTNSNLALFGGNGGNGGACGNCNCGGGGWSSDHCGDGGTGINGGAIALTISGQKMEYQNTNVNKTALTSGSGGSAGSNSYAGCGSNGAAGGTGSTGSITAVFNFSNRFSLDNYNLTFSTSTGTKAIYLTDTVADYFGIFNGSDVSQTTSVYCSAPTVYVGNDSEIDPQLSWTNCPAYPTNTTFLNKAQFFAANNMNNPWIEVGTPDGNQEWNYSGYFVSPEVVSLNVTPINDFLSTCTADTYGFCDVPITIGADDSMGVSNLSSLLASYSDYSPVSCSFSINNSNYITNLTGPFNVNPSQNNSQFNKTLDDNVDYPWNMTCSMYSPNLSLSEIEFHNGTIKVGDIQPLSWNRVSGEHRPTVPITVSGSFNDTRGDPVSLANMTLNYTYSGGTVQYNLTTNSTGGFSQLINPAAGYSVFTYYLKLGNHSWLETNSSNATFFNQTTTLTYPENGTVYSGTPSVNVTFRWDDYNTSSVSDLNCTLNSSASNMSVRYTSGIFTEYNGSFILPLPTNGITYTMHVECTDLNNSVTSVSGESNITFYFINTSLILDGVSNNRTYEYQTTAQLNVSVNNFVNPVCLDIGYPGYGYNYVCNATSNFSYNFPILNPGKSVFYDGQSDMDYVFRHYGWLDSYITIDDLVNISRVRIGINGVVSSIAFDKFDDMDTSSKNYVLAGTSGIVLNLTFNPDISFYDARFTVSMSGTSQTTNLSVDMFNDGIVDWNYNGTVDQYLPQTIELNETLLNAYVLNHTNETTVTISFNVTSNSTTNMTLSAISFYKTGATYPNGVQIDLGNDGGIDAQFAGDLIGDELSISTTADGTNSKSSVCTSSSNCSMNITFNLSSAQSYDDCYFYAHGDGVGTTFTESFQNSSYIENSTLSQDTFFGQVEMQGVSGTFTNGELNSKEIRTLKYTLGTIYLHAEEQKDTGANILYYVSLDNGTHWQQVVSDTTTSITYPGVSPRYRIIMTTNTARTAAAYVRSIILTDLGDYPENLTVDLAGDGIDKNYPAIITDLFKVNLGCSVVNSYLGNCSNLICEVPIYLNWTGPGEITTSQYLFGGTLSSIELDKDIAVKHQVNQRSNITYVYGNETGAKNGTIIYTWLPFPGYSVANNITINLTGSYWQ